jgi:hypothetical protein
MSWSEITIKKGKDDIQAMMRGNEVMVANVLGASPKEVNIDGKAFKVSQFRLDERDNVVYIMLAGAGANTAKEKVADEQSAERGDPDKSGD